MGQVKPVVRKTVCALCVSHYQLDVLDEWFERWAHVMVRSAVPVHGQGALSAFDLWQVEAPPEAFEELESEFFVRQRLPLMAEAVKRQIAIA